MNKKADTDKKTLVCDRPIPATNEIQMFVHCGKCLQSRPNSISPRDYAQLEVGFTPIGLQVWCKRHEVNVVHIDFEGQVHRASDYMAESTKPN